MSFRDIEQSVCVLIHFGVRFFATLWAAALQALLSKGLSREEYWSRLPCLPPGDLPDPGTECMSLMSFSPALIGRSVLYQYCHLGSPFSLFQYFGRRVRRF